MTKQQQACIVRLITILQRLQTGAALNIDALAQGFSVSTKTIQRDLRERLYFLSLMHTEAGYKLQPYYLNLSLTKEDLQRFATLATLQESFPILSDSFLEIGRASCRERV